MAEDLKIPQSELTAKATAFVKKFVADGRRESFIVNARRHIWHFLKFAEGKPLTKTIVKEWALSLNEKSISPNEVMNYIYSVNGLLGYLNLSEYQLIKRRDYMFDDSRKLYYDISSKETFDSVASSRTLQMEDIRNLIFSLNHLVRNLDDYLLDINDLIPDRKYMYIAKDKLEPLFCYCPGYSGDFSAVPRFRPAN